MKALRIIASRIAFGLLTAWAVVTTVFLLFSVTDDWAENAMRGQLAAEEHNPFDLDPPREDVMEHVDEGLEEFVAARGLDAPLHERYIQFLGDKLMLDWGESWATGEAVGPLVADAALRTAMYVLPAILLAIVVGMAIGLYVAINPTSRLANLSRITAYALFALPSFWIGGMLVGATQAGHIPRDPLVFDHLLPIVLVATTMIGGYLSYARAHALEHTSAEFIKLVKAKGASPIRITRHVVRNAAIPLFSMLFTEVLGLLVMSIFVIEVLFGIDGMGLLLLDGVDARDVPLLLGAMFVIIAVGVVGNIIQDISYHYLDPRVGDSG